MEFYKSGKRKLVVGTNQFGLRKYTKVDMKTLDLDMAQRVLDRREKERIRNKAFHDKKRAARDELRVAAEAVVPKAAATSTSGSDDDAEWLESLQAKTRKLCEEAKLNFVGISGSSPSGGNSLPYTTQRGGHEPNP